MPSKNINRLERAFNREIKRLEKLIQIAVEKGVQFDKDVSIPRPEKVTEKHVQLLKSITPEDIFSGRLPVEDNKPVIIDSLSAGLETTRQRTHRPEFKPAHARRPAKPKEKLSEEELHQIRSEAAKRAAETRKAREASDPEYAEYMRQVRKRAQETRKAKEAADPAYKARMDAARRANAEKARANIKPREKKEKVKKTPEELKKIRQEAARKATASRKAHEASDPEFKKKQDAQRKAALEKAREKRAAKPKKEKVKKTPEELKKIRSEAAKRAAETRRKHELEDPEFKARMDEIRKKNLAKAREGKLWKDLENEDLTSEDIDDVFSGEAYLPQEDEIIYDNLLDILSHGTNDLTDYMVEVISGEAGENRADVLRRIKMADEGILEMAEEILWTPYEQIARDNAMKILSLIYGGEIPEDVRQHVNDIISENIKRGRLKAIKQFTNSEVEEMWMNI